MTASTCLCDNCRFRRKETARIDGLQSIGKQKKKSMKKDVVRKNKCLMKDTGPAYKRATQVEALSSDGTAGKIDKGKRGILGIDSTDIGPKRMKKEEVVSYNESIIKVEHGNGKPAQFIDEKTMNKMMKTAAAVVKREPVVKEESTDVPLPPSSLPLPPSKTDPSQPYNADSICAEAHDDDLEGFEYAQAPEEKISSSICAKSCVSVSSASSNSKGYKNWSDGQLRLKFKGRDEEFAVISDVLDIDTICCVDYIFPSVSSKIDVAARMMIIADKRKTIKSVDMPRMDEVRKTPFLVGEEREFGVEYIRIMCSLKMPLGIVVALRILWQKPIMGDFNTAMRAWMSWNGISYSASAGDHNGSKKVLEYMVENFPTPLSVLTGDKSVDMSDIKAVREALIDFDYKKRVNAIGAELFGKGGYAGTGQQTLNAKVMVDSALVSVLKNNGEMVTEMLDVMSIVNTGYKKAAIMRHAWLGVDKAEHIGVDLHILRCLSAIGLVSDKPRMTKGSSSDLRAQELESYLPRELWGYVNDYLCSICQFLGKKDTEEVGIRLLNEVVEKAEDKYKETFAGWNKIIIDAYREIREKKGKKVGTEVDIDSSNIIDLPRRSKRAGR